MSLNLSDLTDPAPDPGPADWNDEGVVIVQNFFPEELLVQYEKCWVESNSDRPRGWPDPIPYTRHPELRDLFCYKPLADLLETLIGEPAGLHLNLTGWVSTERDWHQDSYLNPPWVGDAYAAVWISFADIHPDSGPFQYVPGSHRWPQVTRQKILNALDPDQRDHRWPKFSEIILSPLFENEIKERNVEVVTHLPKRGDLLVWHGRVLHRGSKANVPGMERRSAIAHYSGVNHRHEMPEAVQHDDGGFYFPLVTDLNLYYEEGSVT
jgi:hypothetical protein